MRFGASTLMKGTVEQFFDKARDGFEVVEIVCDNPYTRPLEINTDFLESARKALGVEYTIHCPFAATDIGSLDDSFRERSVREVLEAIEVGFIIEASIIVVHPARGSRGSIEERERIRALEKESLERIHEFADSRNLRLCLENMPSGFPFVERTLASGVMQLAKALDGAGVTFDVGHANTTTVAPARMLEHLGALTTHVHVHDNQGRKDDHLEIGLGIVDWRSVLSTLVRLGYQGMVIDESLSVEAAVRGVSLLRRMVEEVQGLEGSQ